TNGKRGKEVRGRAIGPSGRRVIEHVDPAPDVVLAQRSQLVELLFHQLPWPMQRPGFDHRRINQSFVGNQNAPSLVSWNVPKGFTLVAPGSSSFTAAEASVASPGDRSSSTTCTFIFSSSAALL